MGNATWLADVLRQEGCMVTEIDGWKTRARSGSPMTLDPQVVVGHHTAGAKTGDMPSLNILIHGRSDLPGPLCNLGLSRSGMFYVVAAGPSNNAGPGGWAGFSGNYKTLGIEAENDGFQPWPQVQLDAYVNGSAAILRYLKFTAERWCRHHEWASYKPDPHDIDGPEFRGLIQAKIDKGSAAPSPDQPNEEDGFLAALSEDEQRAIAMQVAQTQARMDDFEKAFKTFLGPDMDGSDERVSFFDKENGMYAKVTHLQTELTGVKAEQAAQSVLLKKIAAALKV